MSAADNLHPVQFRREPDDSYDKAGEYDARGADENVAFGYDEYGYGDSQYNRNKHSDQREVF